MSASFFFEKELTKGASQMKYLDKLSISQEEKQKIVEMGAGSEGELVSVIRASETASRNHLGTTVVDMILSVFAEHDHGKLDELPKMGLFLNKTPESNL